MRVNQYISLVSSTYPPTISQATIVTLNLEIHLHHLAPTPWPSNAEHVSHILWPSGCVYARRHHLRMNEVEVVRWKCEPRQVNLTILGSRHLLVPAVQVIHLQVQIVWHLFWLHGWVYVDPKHLQCMHVLVHLCIWFGNPDPYQISRPSPQEHCFVTELFSSFSRA